MRSYPTKSPRNINTAIWASLVILIVLMAIDVRAESAPRKSGIKWIMDRDVYNSKAEQLGELEDLIIRRNGRIKEAIISTGGFLGFAEKDIAVPFKKISEQKDNIVFDMDAKRFEALPDFDYRKYGLFSGYYYRPFWPAVPGGPAGAYSPPYASKSGAGRKGPPSHPYGPGYGPWYGYGPYSYGVPPQAYPGYGTYENPHPWQWAYYPGRMLASAILGRVVINQQGEEVAEVHDLIFDRNDNVDRIILSLGGFVDTGNKLVAVPYKPLGFTNYGITYDISERDLRDRPAFSYEEGS
jgi:sporulation protein YlmC with PRC-barrel domain